MRKTIFPLMTAFCALLSMPLARAAEAAPTVVATVNKGDVAWMLTATLLVVMMSIPGLALFYGGMARAKNMLSVLMQVFVVFALVSVLWLLFGYSLAFSGGNAVLGDFGKLFLAGIDAASLSDTFSAQSKLPELAFVAFQCSFAAISCGIIVGAFAERMRFAAVLAFIVLWFTFSYLPIAHMVWSGNGYLFGKGALDFAGGTVVHINAGIAGLVGAKLVGRRIGLGREALMPHSLTLTMVGAALLWVGWFGFNAGSALEANGVAALAFVNTLAAASAATLSWIATEAVLGRKPSMLGAASGAIAGLVVITPAAGTVAPMGALVLGLLAGPVCFWGVTTLKRWLGIDDAFDAFGVHGVGGILGALLTGVFSAPALGGSGAADYAMLPQLWVQLEGVLITLGWSGLVSFLAYKLVDRLIGLRVGEEEERIGLDISSHGESAYVR